MTDCCPSSCSYIGATEPPRVEFLDFVFHPLVRPHRPYRVQLRENFPEWKRGRKCCLKEVVVFVKSIFFSSISGNTEAPFNPEALHRCVSEPYGKKPALPFAFPLCLILRCIRVPSSWGGCVSFFLRSFRSSKLEYQQHQRDCATAAAEALDQRSKSGVDSSFAIPLEAPDSSKVAKARRALGLSGNMSPVCHVCGGTPCVCSNACAVLT